MKKETYGVIQVLQGTYHVIEVGSEIGRAHV